MELPKYSEVSARVSGVELSAMEWFVYKFYLAYEPDQKYFMACLEAAIIDFTRKQVISKPGGL